MRTLSSLIAVIILAILVLGACTQTTMPSPAAEQKTLIAGAAAPVQNSGGEGKWNSVLSEAKKEGSVVIYNIWPPETRTALTQAFKGKYGINLEFSSFGTGLEIVPKVQAEQRSGLYLADVFAVGAPTMITYMKPQGLLGPLRPLLILPEVTDSNAWRGGNMPFSDKEGLAFVLIANTIRTIVYNTDLIKDGEISGYRDLLKPEYKGKINMLDPSVTGNSCFAHLGENLWGEAETIDFLRKLIKEQDSTITRDPRLHIETVAKGKYAIGFAPSMITIASFLGVGAPLKLAVVPEDNRISGGSGAIGVPTKLAHPNATTVFVNWLLTKEGQTVFAKSYGMPGTRIDASTEGIDPRFIPEPGKKYYMSDTEEFILAIGKWLERAKNVMEETKP